MVFLSGVGLWSGLPFSKIIFILRDDAHSIPEALGFLVLKKRL